MVENSDFTPSQVGCLFTFLARQLAKPNNTLFVNRTLFDQVKWESTNGLLYLFLSASNLTFRCLFHCAIYQHIGVKVITKYGDLPLIL